MNDQTAEQNQEHSFSTFDLGLAAALVTLEHDLAEIDKTNRSKSQFIFRRGVGIERDIKRYWDGDLQLSARHLFDAQKMLKNRLFSD